MAFRLPSCGLRSLLQLCLREIFKQHGGRPRAAFLIAGVPVWLTAQADDEICAAAQPARRGRGRGCKQGRAGFDGELGASVSILSLAGDHIGVVSALRSCAARRSVGSFRRSAS